MISNRIMKIDEFKNSVIYRASCSCSDPDCDLTLELEIDEELEDMMILNLYKKLRWSSYWHNDKWYINLFNRIKVSLKLLFTGYIEVEESFIFQGKSQIDSFIKALDEGKEKLSK